MNEKPEVTQEELDAEPTPDVVIIVQEEVKRFQILKRRRKLNQSEQYTFNKLLDFLIRIKVHSIEKDDKEYKMDEKQLVAWFRAAYHKDTEDNKEPQQ